MVLLFPHLLSLVLLLDFDWGAVAKIYGPLGLFALGAAWLIVKKLLPYIEKQQKAHIDALQSAVTEARENARSERDYAREQDRERTRGFLEALSRRDEKMESGFRELTAALQASRSKDTR